MSIKIIITGKHLYFREAPGKRITGFLAHLPRIYSKILGSSGSIRGMRSLMPLDFEVAKETPSL